MPFQIRKMRDEGSAEPFMARMWIGVREIMGQLLAFSDVPSERKAEFENHYEPLLTNLELARASARQLVARVAVHREKLKSGTIISRQSKAYSIDETVDFEVRREFAQLLNGGARALKGVQPVLAWLGLSIGHFFQNEAEFGKGQARLVDSGQQDLARYLDLARSDWAQQFIMLRNEHEHAGWSHGDFEYAVVGAVVNLVEPAINGTPITTYSAEHSERCWVFAEELIAYAVSRNLRVGMILAEIPERDRQVNVPRRFKVTLAGYQDAPWRLPPH